MTAAIRRVPRTLPLIVVLLLGAYAIRLYRLDAVPLRGDEAYSVMHWSAPPFTERWELLLRAEPAPVGAFTMYWIWTGLTGRSEFALRFLSVLGNTLALAAVIVLTYRLLRRADLALMAGLLWAINPHLIWHAQDARVYGVLSAISPLAFYALIRALDVDKSAHFGSRHRWWTAYIAFQTAALYLYYLDVFWLAAQGVYVLALRRSHLRQALRVWVIIAVLLIPIIIQVYVLLFQSDYRGNAESAGIETVLTDFVPTLWFGETVWPAWAGAIVGLALIAGLIGLLRRDRRAAGLLLAYIVVPVALLYAVSFFSSFFRPRYVVTITPALIIALVAVAGYGPPLRWRRLTLWAAVLVIALPSAGEIAAYFFRDPPKAADWPEIVSAINQHADADSVVISGAIDPALEYYYTGPAVIYFIPIEEDRPAADWERLIDRYHSFYLLNGLRTGPTAEFFRQHTQPIPGDIFPGVVQFRAWGVDPEEIAQPMNLNFGGVATLRGYSLLGSTSLLLYWEPIETTPIDYSVLVHLEAAPGAPPAAVLDHGVAGGVVSSRLWTPGVIYRDPVALPVDLSSGTYTVRVGLYPSGQPELRLDVIGGRAEEDGRAAIGQLTIRSS
jgi:hypothetical protein